MKIHSPSAPSHRHRHHQSHAERWEAHATRRHEKTRHEKPEAENAPLARGVVRLLEEGHFKGVADVRLRINFHDALARAEAASETEAPEETGGLEETPAEPTAMLPSEADEPTNGAPALSSPTGQGVAYARFFEVYTAVWTLPERASLDVVA